MTAFTNEVNDRYHHDHDHDSDHDNDNDNEWSDICRVCLGPDEEGYVGCSLFVAFERVFFTALFWSLSRWSFSKNVETLVIFE
jgi:hypothetical protein